MQFRSVYSSKSQILTFPEDIHLQTCAILATISIVKIDKKT